VPKGKDEIAKARIEADFHAPLNARSLFKTIAIKRLTKVGDEDAYVIVMTPKNGAPPVTDYVSTKTFRLLRRDTTAETQGLTLPVTETYADWRNVEGVWLPFKATTASPLSGAIVTRVRSVRVNVPIARAAFQPAPPPTKLKPVRKPTAAKPVTRTSR